MKSLALLITLSGLAASVSAQNAPAPGVRMIEPGKESATKADPVSAKPEPIKPAAVEPPAKKQDDHTTIDSDSVAMDTKNSVAVFSGNVTVRGTQFRLTTDGDFEVYMKKQPKAPKPDPSKAGEPAAKGGTAPVAKAGTPPDVTPAAAAAGLSAKPGDPDDGVEKAIAKGKMVTIEKKDEEGKVKIGKARHATFDGKTKDIILRDWPQVQDGQNVIIATSASTTMVLTQAGKLVVQGPARTDIVGNAQPGR